MLQFNSIMVNKLFVIVREMRVFGILLKMHNMDLATFVMRGFNYA